MSSDLTVERSLVSVMDSVGGIPIHALVSVPAIADPGMPLVFVHGLGASVRFLEPTMVRLARGHCVAGPDLPGFGRSGTPAHALDVTELSTALADWLDARRIGPAILIGTSFGCQVIADLACREPARVLGLVLNAPTMDPAHRTVFGVCVRMVADVAFEPWRLALVAVPDLLRAGPSRLLATMHHALDDRIEQNLTRIVAPTIIVAGALDPVVSVAWAGEVTRLIGMARPASPRATLHVVPNAAHALPFDAPVAFAALISAFVEHVRSFRKPR